VQAVRALNLPGLLFDFDLLSDFERRSVRIAMQADDSLNDGGKSGGNFDIGGVRDKGMVIQAVGMHLGGESFFYLGDVPTEHNEATTLGNFVNVQALTLQPELDLLSVIGGDAEALAELCGSQPFVKERR
jgi:hypothetical protein